MNVFSGTYQSIIDAAAHHVAELRSSGTLDEWLRSPIEFLVPSASVATSLTRAIVTLTGGTAGVRIDTIDRLATRIVSAAQLSRRIASASERSVAMDLALRSAATDDPLFSTPGIAALLERSWRDAADSGVMLAELRARTQRHNHQERFRTVVDVWGRYESLLTATGAEDPAWLIRTAIDQLSTARIGRQIIFGFYDVTQLQERFLRALKDAGKVEAIYFPFPFEGREPADAFEFATRLVTRLVDGEEIAPASTERASAAQLQVLRETTRSEEHREVCRAVAAQLASGASAAEIGVVKRMLTPLDIDLLQRSAAAFGFTFNRAPSRPLASTRAGRALILLLDVRANDFRRESVVELAASAIRSSALRGNRRAERIDEISRRCGIVGGPSEEAARVIAQSRFAEYESARDYVGFVAELESLTAGIPDAAAGAAWKRTIDRLVEQIALENESDLAAAAAIDELSSTLARFDASFARADVVAQLRNLEVSDEAARDAVWLGDVMHARGRTFRHLYLLAAEDDQFPQRRSDDPLLPDSVRDQFGVRRIGDGETEERMLFALLAQGATSTFAASFATAEQGGKLKRPSRFLLQKCIELFPEDRTAIVSDFARWCDAKFTRNALHPTDVETRRDELLRGARPVSPVQRALAHAASLRTRSRFDGFISDPEFREVVLRRLALISPTRLERFGDCPQKFLFSSLLNVDELETPEVEVEIEAKKRGQLQHSILEEFYKSLDENDYARADTTPFAKLSSALSARLQQIIDRQLSEFNQLHPPANQAMREIDRATLHKSLQRFVGLDLGDLARSGYRPRHFEFKFGFDEGAVPPPKLEIGEVELSIRGSIDRVDEHADGRVRIIDYKSNRAAYLRKLPELAAAGRALQLPLYALAWEKIFGVDPARIDATVRPLGSVTLDDELFAFNLGELRESVIETLSLFARAIIDGQFPAYPDDGCKFCTVNHSCRAKYDSREHLALRGFRNARDYLRSLTS